MNDAWADAMAGLDEILECCKEAGVTKDEVLREIDMVYDDE